MIVNFFINLLTGFLDWYIGILPQIPNLPSSVLSSVDTFFSFLSSHISLLGFFIRPVTFKSCLVCVIAIVVLEETITYIMWVIKKIPVSTE